MDLFTEKLAASLKHAMAAPSAAPCRISEYGLLNVATVLHDNEAVVEQILPKILGVVCLSVLVCIGIAFGHIAAPVRMLVTNFLPVLCVYGLTAMVYSNGLLDWT